MEWIAAIQQAIAYMEEHLLDDMTYEAAARAVHISGYEFHRAFSLVTDVTPAAYIRSRRLSLAGLELMETDASITELSMKYGYETPESFTKAFTRFHGIAPSHARETNASLVLFNPLALKIAVEGGKSMNYRIVQTKQQQFLALVRSFPTSIINEPDNHDVADFWGECYEKQLISPIRNLLPEGKRNLYGLCMPEAEHADTFDYGIGVLVDDETAPFDLAAMEQDGYRLWDVKPGTYVVFECMGKDGECITETWSKFYKEFLPQTGYATAEATDYEIYFEQGRKGLFCELWVPIVKK